MRREFSSAIKLAAWDACKDNHGKRRCARCRCIIVGRPEYDHIKPDGLGGEPTLENCQVLCKKCHGLKTHTEDRPVMTKADNQKKSAAGVKRKYRWPSRGFPKPRHAETE